MCAALDIEDHDALALYLRETGRIANHESLSIRTLAGGVSNRTVLVERANGPGWVLKQALAKLRVAVDWFSDPARIRREAMGLRHLESLAPPGTITPLVFEDREHNLLAMQAVPEPHENWKSLLLSGRVTMDHIDQFATILGTIHRRSTESGTLKEEFDDRSFFESLRVEPYYLYTAAQVPDAGAFLHELVAKTRCRRLALVHGDYSPKNILIRAGRLILLDHEVIHWGDPAFDVGFALAHLLSKAHHLAAHRQSLAEAAGRFWDHYARTAGAISDADREAMAVRHALGCLLARVAGRSPLEYLNGDQRLRQRSAVVSLMRDSPATVGELILRFICEISDVDD